MSSNRALTKQLVVRVPDNILTLLMEEAKATDRSQAYIVREILREYFERRRHDEEK